MTTVFIKDTHREKRGRPPRDRSRDWSSAATSQEIPGAPEAGRGKEGVSPRASGGDTALQTSRFRTSALRIWERVGRSCFKLPDLRSFVTAALGTHSPSAVPSPRPRPFFLGTSSEPPILGHFLPSSWMPPPPELTHPTPGRPLC